MSGPSACGYRLLTPLDPVSQPLSESLLRTTMDAAKVVEVSVAYMLRTHTLVPTPDKHHPVSLLVENDTEARAERPHDHLFRVCAPQGAAS